MSDGRADAFGDDGPVVHVSVRHAVARATNWLILLGVMVAAFAALSIGIHFVPFLHRNSVLAVVGDAAFVLFFAAGFACGIVYWIALAWGNAEERAGYSTGQYNTRRVRIVDYRTGLVLREADEPPIENREQARNALERAKRHALSGG